MGINDIAVPIKTILIVEIIGVTLFFEKEENNKHNEETDIITRLEKVKLNQNLHIISSSDSNGAEIFDNL